MSRIIPSGWMPECRMQRVITHWTAGAYDASEVDLEHYHFLIEGDGRLVRGEHAVRDNVITADGDYAAHTRALNTGSIGVAVCCMHGAIQEPFYGGGFPMRREQYEAMALAVADLCERYQIPVAPRTVLGHGEVAAILGIAQRGKWDPMRLPWEPDRPARAVGDLFRARVEARLRHADRDEEWPPLLVALNGQRVSDEGILVDGFSWSPLRPLANALGWRILAIDRRFTRLATRSGERDVLAQIRGNRGFVQLRDLCEKAGFMRPEYDPATRTVSLWS